MSIVYFGLGDLFAFLYFELVDTLEVPYLYSARVLSSVGDTHADVWERMQPSVVAAVPIGFLATAIIVVNNLRDRHTDVKVGKRTTAVRFGETFARTLYLILVGGTYL